VRCAAQQLESFALPFSTTGRRMYGGALLAEHADDPATVSEAFIMLLRDQDWTVTVVDSSDERMTLHVAQHKTSYRIVLSASATGSTQITVYQNEP
jgi:hypothetical protein